jgi:hypothetical protein
LRHSTAQEQRGLPYALPGLGATRRLLFPGSGFSSAPRRRSSLIMSSERHPAKQWTNTRPGLSPSRMDIDGVRSSWHGHRALPALPHHRPPSARVSSRAVVMTGPCDRGTRGYPDHPRPPGRTHPGRTGRIPHAATRFCRRCSGTTGCRWGPCTARRPDRC